MHHNLDIHPIPEEVLYINEMDFLEPNYYELKEQIKKAASGKTIAQGGILPDDNVRIYVPMDLNADKIMWRLYRIYMALDDPAYRNETNEGCAECFPYEIIDELEDEFIF